MLADWYRLEWERYYGEHGPGDAEADLESRCNRDVLPVGLVAMEGDRVFGTAALDLDAATNLSPSVVGLLVNRDQRRRGVATTLLQSAERLAGELGYDRVYVSTTILGELLTRLGWQRSGEVEFINDERGSIYVRELQD